MAKGTGSGLKGRGAQSNRDGRFESLEHTPFDDGWNVAEEDVAPLRTVLTEDRARSVITHNDSPDIPFRQSINPYRGCEHGCSYCFARPSHTYLGLSAGLDFESRLFYKPRAAELLANELRRPGYRCEPIALGVNTDAYQPVERRLQITRQLLTVMRDFGQPVSLITKSALIERDLDLLAPMAADGLAEVMISITTLDADLARRMEPRAASPARRLQTIARLAEAGVPVGVLVAPIIPGLTDHEIEAILEAAAEAGAGEAGYVMLRLPHELRELFPEWLEAQVPLRAGHVMSLLRDLRGGRANDPRFGSRMRGEGPLADLVVQRFAVATRRLGLNRSQRIRRLDCTRFAPPPQSGDQLGLFES
ncbi:MAG: PA0069 family radical SAM protein [Gammaproteobacteria bacterium]|nr:PA0069 family radical SAM protein [Gammaproteobacteria bacterium]